MEKKTWEEAECTAITCPFLHAAMMHVRQHHMTREEAMTAAAVALSVAYQLLKQDYLDAIKRLHAPGMDVVR